MRRMIVICASLAALALPAAALAFGISAGDGQLVVQNASGLKNVPVVALTITGAVIGHIDAGKIIIDDPTPNNGISPEVTGTTTGALWHKDVSGHDTAQMWGGTDFKFRAVGGKYTVLIYGSGIDVVALGNGTVTLTGIPESPTGDGRYAVNGGEFHSLPGAARQLDIRSNG
jgi:hypothetical protein